jgi:hypothetical protein
MSKPPTEPDEKTSQGSKPNTKPDVCQTPPNTPPKALKKHGKRGANQTNPQTNPQTNAQTEHKNEATEAGSDELKGAEGPIKSPPELTKEDLEELGKPIGQAPGHQMLSRDLAVELGYLEK